MPAPLPTSSWIERVPRNLLIWMIVCTLSAAPSFALGAMVGDTEPGLLAAMAVGVLIFIVGYTALASTDFVERLKRKPFVTRTIEIGYGIRIAQSLLSVVPPVFLVDMMCGVVSLKVTERLPGHEGNFTGFLLATLIQGTLLNLLLVPLLGIIYGIQRLCCTPPLNLDATRFCIECGYDLRASKGSCPECGHAIPTLNEIAGREPRRKNPRPATPPRPDEAQA